MLIKRLEKIAEQEENHLLRTITAEYNKFFKQPEHKGFRTHERLPVPLSNPFIDQELENPRPVEYEFFSGNYVHVPSPELSLRTSSAPELSDKDTWNSEYWTKYKPTHWTSLSEPEESFEVHWSDIA
jgi:hypothetical protein